MGQHLFDVYANVTDFGALALPPALLPTVLPVAREEATRSSIQDAINSGRHVLFPAGTYRFRGGPIRFPNATQRCTFLAGAILEPQDSSSYVILTGAEQTLSGLRVEVPVHVAARSPVVEIYGASGLVLHELRVSVYAMAHSVSGPNAAVRVMCVEGCTFIGGRISGTLEADTVGLWLANSYDYDLEGDPNPSPGEWNFYADVSDEATRLARQTAGRESSGAHRVGAVGLTIEEFGWAVRIGCVADNPHFVGCAFADSANGALTVTDDGDVVKEAVVKALLGGSRLNDLSYAPTGAVAKGLTLVSCRMSGAAVPWYLLVDADGGDDEPGGAIQGGVIMGCTFGTSVIAGEGDAANAAGPATEGKQTPAAVGAGAGPLSRGQTTQGAGASRRIVPAVAGIGQAFRALGASGARLVPQAIGAEVGRKRSEGAAGAATRSAAAAKAAKSSAEPPDTTCIFRIDGSVSALLVSGCYSDATELRDSVWNITGGATVSQTCDMFNAWAEANVAAGDKAACLVLMDTTGHGRLTVTADELCLDGDAFGFFRAPAASRSTTYQVSGRINQGDRWLRGPNVHLVLGQLLMDLGNLGLVKRS